MTRTAAAFTRYAFLHHQSLQSENNFSCADISKEHGDITTIMAQMCNMTCQMHYSLPQAYLMFLPEAFVKLKKIIPHGMCKKMTDHRHTL